MIDLKSMTPEELAAWFREQGEPAFRAKQVFQWLYRGAVSFDEMTDLPKVLRQKLEEHCFLTAPQVARKQVSAQDGTIKYLWRLSDGNCIETVLMRYKHGNTVCISCQVGCRMGCAFCASTLGGKVRDLTPAEMVDQVLFTQLDSGEPVSNIVLMGIGEPLDNMDTVLKADLLARLLKGTPGHVNLIPLNDVEESPLKPSRRVAAFQRRLEGHGVTVTVRRKLGGDIDASCGQLRRKAMAQTLGRNDGRKEADIP